MNRAVLQVVSYVYVDSNHNYIYIIVCNNYNAAQLCTKLNMQIQASKRGSVVEVKKHLEDGEDPNSFDKVYTHFGRCRN